MSTNYEIREKLKSFQEFQVEMCDCCGYEGSFGMKKAKVPGLLRVPVSLAMLIGAALLWQYVFDMKPLLWFVAFVPVGVFYFFFMTRRDIVCPNCGAKRQRSNQPVTLYDANKYDRADLNKAADDNITRILAYMEQFDATGKREKLK